MNLIERTFQAADLPVLPPPTSTTGVFVLGDGCALPGNTGPGIRKAPGPVVHLPVTTRLQLAELRETPGVEAITLARPGERCELALAFAAHLSMVRAPCLVDGGPVVTAPSPKQSPIVDGLIKILHLVTVHGDSGAMDIAVWEWVTPSGAVTWFGGPVPDIADLHSRLCDLLALRRAARSGQLPGTVDGDALAQLLAGGRYFSGRFVLEHHHLIRRLLGDALTVLETTP